LKKALYLKENNFMLNFCTLFDRNYFYKGLTMYNSLIANCTEDFNLWILCMDDMTYDLLEKMNLPNIKLITLSEFESPELLKIKTERSVAEYSWTCASNFIWFLSQKYQKLKTLIYLDADLYFFNDPKILIEELGDKDVMITEHRYTKKYDQTITSGKYCVQFMIFKNNPNGLMVLDWWRRACLDWCFARIDNGRFGDQKYLDDWMTRFNCIYELQHLGGGVAPWNVQQYVFSKTKNSKIIGKEISSNRKFPLIFYHFHDFHLISKNKYYACGSYFLTKNVKNLIYRQYFKNLQNSLLTVKAIEPQFNFGFKKVDSKKIKDRIYLYMIKSTFFKKIHSKIKKLLSKIKII